MSKTPIPTHIGVIMDGNRRWAKEKRLPALAGHTRVAMDLLDPLIDHAADRGVQYMTFWAWSTENWKRSKREVSGMMRLFRHAMKKQWKRLHEKGVRIQTIGDISAFPKDIQDMLSDFIEDTKDNTRITAIFALNYGGRDELLRAFSKISKQNQELSEDSISNALDTTGTPDPDIIVRTSGEQRLSGFLPWQAVYSEFYFPEWHMPDFTPERLDEVIEEYQKRARRFGK